MVVIGAGMATTITIQGITVGDMAMVAPTTLAPTTEAATTAGTTGDILPMVPGWESSFNVQDFPLELEATGGNCPFRVLRGS